MSYSGSDDAPLCDLCNRFDYHHMCVPWPMPLGSDGRPVNDTLMICRTCVQNLLLESTRGGARQLAYANARRWQEHQALLGDAETAIRDEYSRIADQSRRAWNARHDAEAARRRRQDDEMAAQFRRELDGLAEITGRS
jgi:hypothetical protein